MNSTPLEAAIAVADELEKRNLPEDRWLAIAARKVADDLQRAEAKPRPIRCIDPYGNVAYIAHADRRGWHCKLKHGAPADFFYAIGHVHDPTELRLALERTRSDEERITLLQRRKPTYRFELA